MMLQHNEIDTPTQMLQQDVETMVDQSPERLNGDVTLILQTFAAQKLFWGNKKKHKTSSNLLQFASRMGDIWQAAKRDDPYADWFLVKIFDRLVTLRKELSAAINHYRSQLDASSELTRLNFSLFTSQQPARQSLRFGTQYGYLGASLVADYDELMRIIITANRVGILFDQPHHIIQQDWRSQLLSVFRLPYKWQSFKITRQDVAARNEKAVLAKEHMGKLPDSIQSLKLRSPFAPPILKSVLLPEAIEQSDAKKDADQNDVNVNEYEASLEKSEDEVS